MSTSILAALAVSVILGAPAAQTPLLDAARWLPLAPVEAKKVTREQGIREKAAKAELKRRLDLRRVDVFTDRNVYLAGDGVAVVAVDTSTFYPWDPGAELVVTLEREGAPIGERRWILDASATGKLAIEVPVDALKPGPYAARARVEIPSRDPTAGQSASWSFSRSAESAAGAGIPAEGVPLLLHGMTGASPWPISTGVPMPRGAVHSLDELVLLEDGKPVDVQWTVRSRWSPDLKSSPAWLGLDFVARRRADGTPSEYRVKHARPRAATAPLKVSATDQEITIDTGPARLVVRKRGFDGLHAAWLDDDGDGLFEAGEQRVGGGGGLELVDESGAVHRAASDADAVVTIEESGPVRAVISARGWYVGERSRLCQFVVYLTAYAGVPALFVGTHTIIAHDTRAHHLADVRLRVPVIGADHWSTGYDDKRAGGDVPPAPRTAWLHQERDDALRIVVGDTPTATGRRADGWMALRSSRGGVTVTLRDVWQKYPKELEAGASGIDVHFWPRHGRTTYTTEEQLDPRHIFEARFAHQGPLLDLQMPERYFAALEALDAKTRWDPENTAKIGYRSSAEGVSIGNELAIWLTGAEDHDGDLARTFQAPPHAIAAPAWNVSSGVETAMSARDDARWPLAERTLNEDFPRGMFDAIDHVKAYGMWIYANTFNTWVDGWPGLHRIWQNSHYQQVGESWKLYFRGGSPDLYRWATAQSGLFQDIATVHATLPELDVPGRQIGAMYHAKAFLPWGARLRGEFTTDTDVHNFGHFIDPDAYLWRYVLTGDLFSRDLYRAWIDSIGRGTYPVEGNGRDSINDLAMVLAAYRFTWDPSFIFPIRRGAEATLAVPLTQGGNAESFAVWNKRWPDRYWDLTRDDRVIAAIQRFTAAGFAHPAPIAFLYRHTKDPAVLREVYDAAYELPLLVYRDLASPLHGFASYTAARKQEALLQLPEYLGALTRAGMSERSTIELPGHDLAGATLALNADGKPFHVRVGPSLFPGNAPQGLVVRAPSGKIIKRIIRGEEKGLKMPEADDDLTLRLPRDAPPQLVEIGGERGIFRIERFGYAPVYALPLTDLLREIIALGRPKALQGIGRVEGVLVREPGSSATVKVIARGRGPAGGRTPGLAYVRIGKQLETTLYDGAQRSEVSVDIPAGSVTPVLLLGDFGLSWSGEGELYLARSEADAKAVLGN